MFLGSPAEGLTPQWHHEHAVGWEEGFLGKAKNNRQEPSLAQIMCLSPNWGCA